MACTSTSASGITTLAACAADGLQTWVNSDGVASNGCESWSGQGCPTGAAASGKYCSDLAGECVGPGGPAVCAGGVCTAPGGGGVNNKYKGGSSTTDTKGISRPTCQASCDATPACVGYSYRAWNSQCFVHGPGLDTDLGGGWVADSHFATTIGGATGHSNAVCAAVAGRN
eukprot:SAG25_NODE_345_length_9393_cov_4.870468_3_plen_171_part_00